MIKDLLKEIHNRIAIQRGFDRLIRTHSFQEFFEKFSHADKRKFCHMMRNDQLEDCKIWLKGLRWKYLTPNEMSMIELRTKAKLLGISDYGIKPKIILLAEIVDVESKMSPQSDRSDSSNKSGTSDSPKKPSINFAR